MQGGITWHQRGIMDGEAGRDPIHWNDREHDRIPTAWRDAYDRGWLKGAARAALNHSKKIR